MKVKSKINVAQIGAGSFGVKRAESVQKCESAKLIAIADADKATSKRPRNSGRTSTFCR